MRLLLFHSLLLVGIFCIGWPINVEQLARDPLLLTKHFMQIVKCKQHLWPCLMRYSFYYYYYYLSLHSSAFIVKVNEKRENKNLQQLISFNTTNKTSTPSIQCNIFQRKERSEPNTMAKKPNWEYFILILCGFFFVYLLCCIESILNIYQNLMNYFLYQMKWIRFVLFTK